MTTNNPSKKSTADAAKEAAKDNVKAFTAAAARNEAAVKDVAETAAKASLASASAARDTVKEITREVVKQARPEKIEANARQAAKLGGDAVREFWETSARELRETQSKILAFGREASTNLSKSTEAASRNLSEVLELSRENVEAVVETTNVTGEVARNLAEEIYGFANQAFTNSVEHSKSFLSCRTINDVLDVQNKYFLTTVDLFFNQSVKMSDMLFRFANDAAEPLQSRAASATKRFSKSLSK
jgi:hypothetical protein